MTSMMNKPFFALRSRPGIVLFLSSCLVCGAARAATLDDRAGGFVGSGRWLLTEDLSYFTMGEAAHHASASYDDVSAHPEFVTLDTRLTFPLLTDVELSLGHAEGIPADYSREIFDPSGSLSATQDYELNYLRDYAFSGRIRLGRVESYVSFLEKTQKASWFVATYPAARSYFSYIRAHFEEGRWGLRYLSEGGGGSVSNLSRLEGVLLDEGQGDVEAGLSFDRGRLRRNVAYYFGGALISDNMYHDLENRFIPGVRVAYGVREDLEATAGVSYALPYDYIYEYRRDSAGGLTVTHGDYRTRHEMNFPLGVRYRLVPNAEVSFSSDTTYAQQRLDYWQRATTGVVTPFPARKLKYLNTRPTVTLSYLVERGRGIVEDAFTRLTGARLAKGQSLLKMLFKWDVTTLDKSSANGAQNRIDPTNVFLYPLDYFLAGSEYAAYYTGNTSGSATNVAAQNYGLLRFDALHGITDDVSAGFVVGYRTSSRFHHFTVGGSTAYDLQARHYVLKPYWFFGVPFRWRPTQNILVSLDWHYVPRYRSTVAIAGQTEDFEAKTEYHNVLMKVQILF